MNEQELAEQYTLVPMPRWPNRPDWDSYFMLIARAVASRATCSRGQVGCVIVDEKHRIVATGYNGAPSGEPHCDHSGAELVYRAMRPRSAHIQEIGSFVEYETVIGQPGLKWDEAAQRLTCANVFHAEENAMDYLHGVMMDNRSFPSRGGLTLYTTHSPCVRCASLIRMNRVIKRVVYSQAYNLGPEVRDILSNVTLEAHA